LLELLREGFGREEDDMVRRLERTDMRGMNDWDQPLSSRNITREVQERKERARARSQEARARHNDASSRPRAGDPSADEARAHAKGRAAPAGRELENLAASNTNRTAGTQAHSK
jgi:hypothetical protein